MIKMKSKLLREIEKLEDKIIKVRSVVYSGKGRPKKSDYKLIKWKDLNDFYCLERLLSGFTTNYT